MKKNLKELMYGKQTNEWIGAEHLKLMGMVSRVGVTHGGRRLPSRT